MLRRELELTEEAGCLFDRHTAHLADVFAIDLYLARFYAEASPPASRAKRVSAIAAEKNADVQFVLLPLEMLEEAPDATETTVTIDDQLLLLSIEFVPGNVQRNPGLPREAFELREQRPIFWLSPGLDRTFIQSLAFVGNDEVEIEIDSVAEALATRAGAVRIVE